MEDSLEKMQVELTASGQAYRGPTDLPALLELATDEDKQYLLIVESDIVSEPDYSFSWITGTGSIGIEATNTIAIYGVSTGERLFFRTYRRKETQGGVTKHSFVALQTAAEMTSQLTNQNLNQFWEDAAFELRAAEEGQQPTGS